MSAPKKVIRRLFNKHVKGTPKGALVLEVTTIVCRLSEQTQKVLDCEASRVYIGTKVIKHLYDKRIARQFDLIIGNLHTIIKYPDFIFENKKGKRGNYCFLKILKNEAYLSILENKIPLVPLAAKNAMMELDIVTCFKMEDPEAYLKEEDYKLLWSWRDGGPSS